MYREQVLENFYIVKSASRSEYGDKPTPRDLGTAAVAGGLLGVGAGNVARLGIGEISNIKKYREHQRWLARNFGGKSQRGRDAMMKLVKDHNAPGSLKKELGKARGRAAILTAGGLLSGGFVANRLYKRRTQARNLDRM
jgi:hypothetical protein